MSAVLLWLDYFMFSAFVCVQTLVGFILCHEAAAAHTGSHCWDLSACEDIYYSRKMFTLTHHDALSHLKSCCCSLRLCECGRGQKLQHRWLFKLFISVYVQKSNAAVLLLDCGARLYLDWPMWCCDSDTHLNTCRYTNLRAFSRWSVWN